MDWRCGSREGRKRERAEGREGEKEGEKGTEPSRKGVFLTRGKKIFAGSP
jgi:hypothetical protein